MTLTHATDRHSDNITKLQVCHRYLVGTPADLLWMCPDMSPIPCRYSSRLVVDVSRYVTDTLHMAENSFTRTTYVSPFKANTSANWNAVSRQIWRRCHTSVDSGDLNQAPPKQSAACSTCIIPALPVNCQFIWMACAFGMSATQPILE